MADTWKLLKQKQKLRINNIMFEVVCDVYQKTGKMPSEEQYEELIRKVYPCCNTRKIDFQDLLKVFIKKQKRFAERINTHGVTETKTVKIKKTDAEKREMKREMRKRKKQKIAEEDLNLLQEQDDVFSFIAGYTSGGAPYGVQWCEDDVDFDSDLPFL